jgi:hypothetical protein
MSNDYLNIQKQMEEEQRLMKAAKTKEDLNAIWGGRTIIVNDNSDWHGERCIFIEMVGEGSREKWKMKLETPFGTFLELPAKDVIIVTHTIKTTQSETDKIIKHFKK